MFELVKKIFIGLLIGTVSASNHAKSVLLSNQKFMIQPTNVNVHLNAYSQEFHYYPFLINEIDTIFWMIYLINYVFLIKQKI